MKRATAYQRDASILVHPSSRTSDGVWILSEPCVRLSSDCDDAELGEVILSALGVSRLSLPHPTDWRGILEPLLKCAGLKTWKSFVRGAVCVEVEERGEQLEFWSTRNLGSDQGFEVDESKRTAVTLPASPVAIGAALRDALASAE